MDAFKLLTRSTNFKSRAGKPQANSSVHLPSSGGAKNPQLFPDTGAKSRGKKRKRAAAASAEKDALAGADEEEVSGELDFFGAAAGGNKDDKKKGRSDAKKTDSKHGGVLTDTVEGNGSVEDEDRLPEDECRSVLRSHKIKITNLSQAIEQPAETPVVGKKVKKSKKRKEEPPAPLTAKQRKEAAQLYPQPLTTFEQLRSRYQIPKKLYDNVKAQGYKVPTEVQLGTLPLLLGGKTGVATEDTREPTDLLAVAPTGSGKTIAFLIPLINDIIARRRKAGDDKVKAVSAIIVAPTRELSGQICNEGRKLALGTGVKVSAMRKRMRLFEEGDSESSEEAEDESASESGSEDEKPKKQGKATVVKSDILVTTPLMLVNALLDGKTKEIRPLTSVLNLVLDEADVLLDKLFQEQTLKIWTACTHAALRVGLWSATMGANIEDLTKSTITSRHDTLGLKTASAPLIRLVVGLKDSAVPNVTHKLTYAATEQGKLLGLRQLLRPSAASATSDNTHLRPPFLIFTQTIPRAIALHSELLYDIPSEAGGSSRIAVLHSDLSDTLRSDIMTRFRRGEIWILITTDLLSRGVDFKGINGVVNYDIPNSAAAYVHRVGRTGRAGREGGVAVTFYTKEDIPYVKMIANVIASAEKLRSQSSTSSTSSPSIQSWLLDSLPDLSKNDKKELKKKGVAARRPLQNGADEKAKREAARMRISTKSGFERRMENRKRGAVMGSRGRAGEESGEEDSSWEGFD